MGDKTGGLGAQDLSCRRSFEKVYDDEKPDAVLIDDYTSIGVLYRMLVVTSLSVSFWQNCRVVSYR